MQEVALNYPDSSSAEEAVSNLLDSSSFSKAPESLLKDQNLAKLSPKEVSLALLHESVHDRRAPEMVEEAISNSLDSSFLEVSLASLRKISSDGRDLEQPLLCTLLAKKVVLNTPNDLTVTKPEPATRYRQSTPGPQLPSSVSRLSVFRLLQHYF